MKWQQILLSIFGLMTVVAISGCTVHEHDSHWGHHHEHDVTIEHH
ncbi:MAG TPA: hypothetical protein VGG19_09095 [Tepidisphaeraceae bacterium]|jgi:hypothetical protein